MDGLEPNVYRIREAAIDRSPVAGTVSWAGSLTDSHVLSAERWSESRPSRHWSGRD